MKTRIAEVQDTFDNDNYIKQNTDGTFTLYVCAFDDDWVKIFHTEAEAVITWVTVWNKWYKNYLVNSKYNRTHAKLTDKAQPLVW